MLLITFAPYHRAVSPNGLAFQDPPGSSQSPWPSRWSLRPPPGVAAAGAVQTGSPPPTAAPAKRTSPPTPGSRRRFGRAGQGRHPAAAPGEAAERGAPGDPQAADRRGRVDVAICVVLRDGLLRRSEAADLRWEDVTFQASGARGALLEVRRSKTCWPSGRPTLTRRPRSSGSPTDRSAGGSAPRRSTPGWS